MSSALNQLARRLPATRLGASSSSLAPQWSLPALQGRLVELSGQRRRCGLSVALTLVLNAQRLNQPAVWLHLPESSFFAPDAALLGVDLGALPLVRCHHPVQAATSATRLAQSGGFGLIVLDLVEHSHLPIQSLTRLAKQAARARCLILCLTQKSPQRPSLGPLISLHMNGARESIGPHREHYTLTALKDHLASPGWSHQEVFHVPPSLSST